ncbi:ADP-ribosylation factor GTPase-activating protein AGD2-like [Silene latifolia]|uniref:ADP-ribosylation factor GTPase-activating protein AGD2-like n=1 Tax=Silene latifolia TaxID=37657 RepID=UPI003D788999
MAAFFDLEDSPMFQKQVCSLEQSTDDLKNRCQRLHKGCKKFVASLTEACNGDTIFADALESFGGGQEDPLSLSMGGPLISKFIGAFRELATYKELLRSQVEHVLVDRLTQFMSVDLEEAKDSRRRFDKSIHSYDQAREKYASLKKSTREDIVAGQEEDLHNSKSAFERTRFSLVNALMNVESKKKYEFLESFSAIMDAHLRYFKLGYDLLSQMEPLIHQVLTYAQQSKEASNAEQDKLGRRIQEFRTQVQMDNLHASSSTEALTNVDCPRPIGIGPSYKDIQALMQSSANGMVQTIKQGYLLKHSSSLRANWKRRFFVLDSRGTLYYYRTKGPKPMGSNSNQSTNTGEQSNGVFGRFRARHSRTSSLNGESSLSCRTVDLRTSTIKIDAEDLDLRLCFRIISPSKSYTLQAETEADRMEWINKITGVITSLLNAHLSQQEPFIRVNEKHNSRLASEPVSNIQTPQKQGHGWGNMEMQTEGVSGLLREIPGNDQCAECSAPEPDWASLNFGILMCIECSGAHRNLGVHISKVRSITLDVRVWEPTILELFKALGNAYCNSVWEELLSHDKDSNGETECSTTAIVKPSSHDSFNKKEKYIHMKYAEKQLISQKPNSFASNASALWEAVKASNLQEAYRLIAISDTTILNTTYNEIQSMDSLRLEETLSKEGHNLDPSACPRLKPGEPENCLRGCSLLHLACQVGNAVMIELLLQSGVDVNMRDFHGRTPLHHCIAKKDNELAKYILRRGARRLIKDWGGLTALERAMELGSITDEQLFILLSENE